MAVCHFTGGIHAPPEGMKQGGRRGLRQGMEHPWRVAAPL